MKRLRDVTSNDSDVIRTSFFFNFKSTQWHVYYVWTILFLLCESNRGSSLQTSAARQVVIAASPLCSKQRTAEVTPWNPERTAAVAKPRRRLCKVAFHHNKTGAYIMFILDIKAALSLFVGLVWCMVHLIPTQLSKWRITVESLNRSRRVGTVLVNQKCLYDENQPVSHQNVTQKGAVPGSVTACPTVAQFLNLLVFHEIRSFGDFLHV